MTDRIKSLLVYSAKCITGCIAVFTIGDLIHYADISWALISVMLVLSPDGKDALPLAMTRIKANFVGAAVAIVCLLIYPESNMWLISIALFIALALCYLFKLDTGIKSALAATIIIMLHHEGKHLWDTSFERITSVLAGCLLALVITFIFHFKLKKGDSLFTSHHNEA